MSVYYLLENERGAHSKFLLETLESWTEQEADLLLVSQDGTTLETHRVYLKMYSTVLNTVLSDFNLMTVPTIFVPVSTVSLINLIKVLSCGLSVSNDMEDLADVVSAAELLGIKLKDIQIGVSVSASTSEETIFEEKENEDDDKKKTKKTKQKQNKSRNEITDSSAVVKTENYDFDEEAVPNEQTNQEIKIKQEIISDSLPVDAYIAKKSEPSLLKKYLDFCPPAFEDAELSRNSKESATCTECGKTLASKEKLTRHLVIHTGEKPFPCDECELKYSRKDKLDYHRKNKHSQESSKLHTVEKPFACEECESKYTRKDKLQNHKKMKHCEESSYECFVCSKQHSSKWHLNKHMEVHGHFIMTE